MLEQITALITGASGGIGRQIAVQFASSGANVVLAARSEGIYETAELIGEDASAPIETDVTEEGSVEETIRRTVSEFGGLDCVVNNAGIAGPTAPIEDISAEDWEKTMGVNVTGQFLTAKHTIPYLRQSDQGSIINVSSISGKRPLENRTPYVTSKMAVIGLTRTLAFELGPDDVTVNAICPGATTGDRIRRIIQQQANELGVSYEEAKQIVFTDDSALGELVTPDAIAELAVFLASDRARHITAQDINVDGGSVWY